MTNTKTKYPPPPERLQVNSVDEVLTKPFTPESNLYYLPPEKMMDTMQGDFDGLALTLEKWAVQGTTGSRFCGYEELKRFQSSFNAVSSGVGRAVHSVLAHMECFDAQNPSILDLQIVGRHGYDLKPSEIRMSYPSERIFHMDLLLEADRRILVQCSHPTTQGLLPGQAEQAIKRPSVVRDLAKIFERNAKRNNRGSLAFSINGQQTAGFSKYIQQINWAYYRKKGVQPFSLPQGGMTCFSLSGDKEKNIEGWVHRAPYIASNPLPRLLIRADFKK